MDFGKIKVDRSWANVLTVALANPMYLELAQVLTKGIEAIMLRPEQVSSVGVWDTNYDDLNGL
jgi:hypothetical protein